MMASYARAYLIKEAIGSAQGSVASASQRQKEMRRLVQQWEESQRKPMLTSRPSLTSVQRSGNPFKVPYRRGLAGRGLTSRGLTGRRLGLGAAGVGTGLGIAGLYALAREAGL